MRAEPGRAHDTRTPIKEACDARDEQTLGSSALHSCSPARHAEAPPATLNQRARPRHRRRRPRRRLPGRAPPTENGSAYATTAFNLPFDVTIPEWLDAAPSIEQPNFVTWESRTGDRAVRFLIPVSIYPPGGADAIPPPHDYLDYLLAQTAHGAHFTNETHTTVGGKPTTIVTATVDDSLDGSLGCPDSEATLSDCFGLQPDLVLRIAVIDTGIMPLLVWHRGSVADTTQDTTADNESFAELLASVRFSDRPVQAPAAPATSVAMATPLDGTYRWTLTEDDAVAHAPGGPKPEELATFPWAFTMTMEAGTWELVNRAGDGVADAGHGAYTVEGDHIVFDENTEQFDYTFRVDTDGTVHLVAQPPINPNTAWVFATNPWTKID